MIMNLNELMIRHSFVTKINLKDGEKELSKSLKAKVMNMRINLGKYRRQFDEDVKEAIAQMKPESFDELMNIPEDQKTESQKIEFKEMSDKINADYEAFIAEKGAEEKEFNVHFTEDEFAEIVEVNAGNDTDINGTPIKAEDFLEVIYTLFVE